DLVRCLANEAPGAFRNGDTCNSRGLGPRARSCRAFFKFGPPCGAAQLLVRKRLCAQPTPSFGRHDLTHGSLQPPSKREAPARQTAPSSLPPASLQEGGSSMS